MHCIKVTLVLMLGLFLSFCATSVYSSANDQETIRKLIEETQKKITQQKQKEKSVLNNLIQQQKKLNNLENNYDKLSNKLNTVQKRVKLTKQEQYKIERNLTLLEKSLTERQSFLNKRLIATYKYGPQSYLRILFEAHSFVDLISRFSTIAYFIRNDINTINEVQGIKTQVNISHRKIQIKKAQVESEFNRIVSLQNQVSQTQQKVASTVNITKQELSKIQSNRIELEKALEELEQTSKEIGAEIRKDREINPGTALGTGNMRWPVFGRITSNYGWRNHPVLKKKKYHSGLDIAVKSGTEVHAADSGIIIVSGWRGGYGNFVAIDHGNGISTCYGHNSRLLVKVGEKVSKGQTIALSGNTGLSTGPHVHFEVRRQGVPINPIPYLP